MYRSTGFFSSRILLVIILSLLSSITYYSLTDEFVISQYIVNLKEEGCTGFIIGTNTIATARHCVSKKNTVIVFKGNDIHATILLISETYDIAIYRTIGIEFTNHLRLAKNLPEIGTELTTMGHGLGRSYLQKQRLNYRGISLLTNTITPNTPTAFMEFEGQILSGYSGAPIFNSSNGVVYGVVSMIATNNTVFASPFLKEGQ